jgi:hypothetical protein
MSDQPLILFHFKLVARISIAVSVVAVLVLLAVLGMAGGGHQISYGAIIRQHNLTRQYLGVAMLVAGLLLVALSGTVTWLIVYYSSVRVAGPLHRFAQNLRLARAGDLASPLRVRRGDALASHADMVEQAIVSLRSHYVVLEAARAAAAQAAAAGDAPAYAVAVARLKEYDARIRL